MSDDFKNKETNRPKSKKMEEVEVKDYEAEFSVHKTEIKASKNINNTSLLNDKASKEIDEVYDKYARENIGKEENAYENMDYQDPVQEDEGKRFSKEDVEVEIKKVRAAEEQKIYNTRIKLNFEEKELEGEINQLIEDNYEENEEIINRKRDDLEKLKCQNQKKIVELEK